MYFIDLSERVSFSVADARVLSRPTGLSSIVKNLSGQSNLFTFRPGIVLVAHDACKREMIEWARANRETLSSHMLYTTGTTGSLIGRELDLRVHHY